MLKFIEKYIAVGPVYDAYRMGRQLKEELSAGAEYSLSLNSLPIVNGAQLLANFIEIKRPEWIEVDACDFEEEFYRVYFGTIGENLTDQMEETHVLGKKRAFRKEYVDSIFEDFPGAEEPLTEIMRKRFSRFQLEHKHSWLLTAWQYNVPIFLRNLEQSYLGKSLHRVYPPLILPEVKRLVSVGIGVANRDYDMIVLVCDEGISHAVFLHSVLED